MDGEVHGIDMTNVRAGSTTVRCTVAGTFNPLTLLPHIWNGNEANVHHLLVLSVQMAHPTARRQHAIPSKYWLWMYLVSVNDKQNALTV